MAYQTGAYAVSWDQVLLDGLVAPSDAMQPGVSWSWSGVAVRMDGPPDVLLLENPIGQREMQARIARRYGRVDAYDDPDEDQGDGFILTDGRSSWRGRLIARPGGGELCLFRDGLPPSDCALWVVSDRPRRMRKRAPVTAGLTLGSRIETDRGVVTVEELYAGDQVHTRDNGWQELLWIGRRRVTGPQLWAQPQLAPVRIRGGALGIDEPSSDMMLSPDHRLVIRGPRAVALFSTDEVLVRARDLIDGGLVTQLHGLPLLTYVTLAFEHHQIIRVDGVEVETYHPVAHSLDGISEHERAILSAILPDVTEDPQTFGGFARRCLTRAEAAILQAEAPNPRWV